MSFANAKLVSNSKKGAKQMERYAKITGEKVYLAPLDVSDAPIFTKWVNDIEITQNLQIVSQTISAAREKDILESMCKSGETVLSIIDKETNNIIGVTGLHKSAYGDHYASLGIFIGDKNYHSHGYGTEALKLIADYAFNILRYHALTLHVYAYNKRAIRCYEKVGFKHVGTLREAVYIYGKYYDSIIMDLLASEFESPLLKKRQQIIES